MNDRVFRVVVALSVFALIGTVAAVGSVAGQNAGTFNDQAVNDSTGTPAVVVEGVDSAGGATPADDVVGIRNNSSVLVGINDTGGYAGTNVPVNITGSLADYPGNHRALLLNNSSVANIGDTVLNSEALDVTGNADVFGGEVSVARAEAGAEQITLGSTSTFADGTLAETYNVSVTADTSGASGELSGLSGTSQGEVVELDAALQAGENVTATLNDGEGGTLRIATLNPDTVPLDATATVVDTTTPSGPTDNTVQLNTTLNRNVQVADVSFDSPGNVSQINIRLDGAGSVDVTTDDVDDIQVELLNENDQVIETNSTSYETLTEEITFDSTAATVDANVSRVVATAGVSDVATNGTELDATFSLRDDDSGDIFSNFDTQNTQVVLEDATRIGFLRAAVEDQAGNPIDGEPFRVIRTATGTTAFEGTVQNGNIVDAQGNENIAFFAEDTGTDYTLVIDAVGFVTFSSTETLEPQSTQELDVTLVSDREPDELGVAAFDEGDVETVGDSRAFLANGEIDNRGTYVVYAQDQLNDSFDEFGVTQNVNLTIEDPGTIFDTASAGDNTTQLDITIDGNSPTADASNFAGISSGDVSYETFEVTAANATPDTLGNEAVEDALINAKDIQDNTIQDTANATYILQGNQTMTGDVREVGNQLNVENVSVWAAYDGLSNKSYEFVRNTFVDDSGEPFLSTQSTEDGYVIEGLVTGDAAPNFTLYAQVNGNSQPLQFSVGQYNTINDTEAGLVAADYDSTNILGGVATTDVAPITQDVVLTPEELELEYKLDVTVDDGDKSTTLTTTENDLPAQTTVEVDVEQRPVISNDPADFTPATNQEIDLSLVDTGDGTPGSLENATVETGSDGTATTNYTYDAFPNVQESLNVSASTENSEGVVYNTTDDDPREFNNRSGQAEIELTTFGQITGDIVDSDDNNIPNANVTLFKTSEPGNPVVDTTQSGPGGSYTFVDLPTGDGYRVEAEFQGETGFNAGDQLAGLAAGSTNADIVITGIQAPQGFEVDGLEPQNAEVEQGTLIDVSANITNIAGERDTREVTVFIENESGTEVLSSTVTRTIDPSATQLVEFADIDTGALEPGNYTHGIRTQTDEETSNLTVTQPSNGGNPFVADDGTATERNEVVADIGNWLANDEIDGTAYTRDEVVDFIGDWLAAQ